MQERKEQEIDVVFGDFDGKFNKLSLDDLLRLFGQAEPGEDAGDGFIVVDDEAELAAALPCMDEVEAALEQ
jgi:hypothetical protein